MPEIDYTRQPVPWSILFGTTSQEEAEPDLSGAASVPHGFRIGHKRAPAGCQHAGNPAGFTWCKDCGTRLMP